MTHHHWPTRLAAALLCVGCNQAAYPLTQDVTIPIELANNNVYLKVRVDDSPPVWFLLDTGDKYALVDLAMAQSLGVALTGDIDIHGGSGGSVPGRFVGGSRFSLVGLDGFSQPLFLALPLGDLAKATGHELDGILGYNFLSQFIVEVDYVARTVTLHDRNRFQYHGSGEIIPITFDASDNPRVHARVTIAGHEPINGTFFLDMGASDALLLDAPLLDRARLLPLATPSISRPRPTSVGGAVGAFAIGRIEALTLGTSVIQRPVVAFAETTGGHPPSHGANGTIGGEVLRRFHVFLDYGRKRLILEPNVRLGDPIELGMSGLQLTALGHDYRTLTVDTVFARSPASEADIQKGDSVIAIDGRGAGEYTLSEIRDLFRREGSHNMTLARGQRRLTVTLALRRLI